jgi:hypothetical protein
LEEEMKTVAGRPYYSRGDLERLIKECLEREKEYRRVNAKNQQVFALIAEMANNIGECSWLDGKRMKQMARDIAAMAGGK